MVAWNKKPLKINVEIRVDVMAEIKQEEAKSNITVVEKRHKCRITIH